MANCDYFGANWGACPMSLMAPPLFGTSSSFDLSCLSSSPLLMVVLASPLFLWMKLLTTYSLSLILKNLLVLMAWYSSGFLKITC